MNPSLFIRYLVDSWFFFTLAGYIGIPVVILKGRNVRKATQRRYAKAIATYLIICVVGVIELATYSQFVLKEVSQHVLIATIVMSAGLVILTWLLMIRLWGES